MQSSFLWFPKTCITKHPFSTDFYKRHVLFSSHSRMTRTSAAVFFFILFFLSNTYSLFCFFLAGGPPFFLPATSTYYDRQQACIGSETPDACLRHARLLTLPPLDDLPTPAAFIHPPGGFLLFCYFRAPDILQRSRSLDG